MSALAAITRLLWSPRSLAAASISTPLPLIVTASAVAATIDVTAAAWVIRLPGGKPYPDVATALIPRPFQLTQGLLFVFVWCLMAVIWIAATSPRRDEMKRAAVHTVLLSPVPCVLPLVLWLPLGSIAAVASIAPDIIAGVPSWMESPVVRTLGSPAWLVILGGFWVYWLVRASRRLTAIFGPDSVLCAACLYDLSGLDPGAPCPECGRPRGAP